MARKHYELIARRISRELTLATAATSPEAKAARASIVHLAQRLADDLATDNPRFDCERFLLACEPRAIA